MLLMGLRLAEGIDEARFAARTGAVLDDAVDHDTLQQAIEAAYLTRADGRLTASSEGRLRLDALLAALVR
jgi:coproporphyrinogen III oxidase-like Fe-S oxidoreductase